MADHPLIADVEAFLAAHDMAESTFGRLAVNDWKLVRDLRGKRRLWPETEAKIRRFMATYRPPLPGRPDPFLANTSLTSASLPGGSADASAKAKAA